MPLNIRSVPAMAGADYRGRSELLFARLVADLKEVGDRDRCHDRRHESRRSGSHDQARRIGGGHPLIEAERAGDQLADRVLEPNAPWAFLELAGTGVPLM